MFQDHLIPDKNPGQGALKRGIFSPLCLIFESVLVLHGSVFGSRGGHRAGFSEKLWEASTVPSRASL